jgi:hypothetical protein
MELVSEAQSASKAIQKVNFNAKSERNRRDAQSSIVIGDDVASTTRAIERHEASRQQKVTASMTASETRAASATVATKQNKSAGVASTVVQSTDQEAAIMAVNTDKFASSLRESAGVQIGVQKDLSVIDAHRRQSMIQSNYQQESRQAQHQSQLQQQQQNFYGGGGGESYSRWSNSAHAEQRQYSAQQAAMKSTWSQASQQQQRQYQQQFQQQRQQKMAWQEQQSSTQTFSASKRKTWAESSVFHGGALTFAGTSGYHDHGCPASTLSSAAAQVPAYKFERQTSSGHRMFLPTISN